MWLAVAGLVIAGTAAWLLLGRGTAFSLVPDPNQNVLLVTIDTLRADALGSYGGRAATPNFDRLAREGARFDYAHAHAVVTLPSHTSILTGRYPYEHGMRDNSGFRVKDGTITLATRLKARGFATGAFVGGFPVTKRFGLNPGFDTYDDQVPELLTDQAHSMPERRADEVVGRATAWVGAQASPFFAWVHVFDPHAPYQAPEPYRAQHAARPYDGEVAWVDHAFGPLFERLRTLTRPTLVIVTSDHGEGLGDHGELTHGMFAYEATLRVPLIVARVEPDGRGAPRGVVVASPARHIDIAPTVLEAVGAAGDPTLPGSSLVSVIAARSGPDRPSYFEAMTYNLVRGWAPLRGVIVEREKYIDLPIREWYDLKADPAEATNAAGLRADRVQVLYNVLKSFDLSPPNRPAQETKEVSEALRALGYISGTARAKDTYTEADDPKRLVDVDRDLHTATEFFQTGKTAEAITMFESVIRRRDDMADAYIQLANAHWVSGRALPAIEALERGLRAGAADRDIRIKLGLYLAESGIDAGKAIQILEGLPSTDAEAMNSLGVAYGRAGRFAEATKAFQQILSLDATNGLALQNLAFIAFNEADTLAEPAKTERQREAEAFARQAIVADPSLAKAHTTLGVILARTGRKGEAIETWKRGVALDGGELDALYNLTVLLVEAGRLDEARRYAQQFVTSAPPGLDGIEQMRRVAWGR